MIEGYILRASNQMMIQERISSAFIGGLVSHAKGDILTSLLASAEGKGSGDIEIMAWGHFGPVSRDRLRLLTITAISQVTECLHDYISMYDRLIHREILASNVPLGVEHFEMTQKDLAEYDLIKIDDKSVGDWVSDILETHSKNILATCHTASVKNLTPVEFVVKVGVAVDANLTSARNLLELCFTSFAAEWLRRYNNGVIEAFAAGANAD